MTSSSTTDPEVHTDRLFVGFGSDSPDCDRLTVFAETTVDLCDAPAEIAVIGSSHYVYAPDLAFREMISCKSLSHDAVAELSLPEGDDRRLRYAGESVIAETAVSIRDIDTYPAGRDFELAYEFEPDAYTAIAVDGDGYETYHTYPEHGCLVYSETVLGRTDDAATQR
ncbi:Protein of unknown function DUF2617 [Halorientalis persicus]|jgi:hypothetical protein|uniref:DUF2617 family protein n=1 Tax=Halorientalis persicus TaxID=1367881 RepID=A0A1H8DT89_9EURY|nr:DUF2617 family protein [Halorientalis persicus]SEN10531.1 Protein of unknown function DUF2617 [Halorientalis persicus]